MIFAIAVASLFLEAGAAAEETAGQIRARLLATPLESDVAIGLRIGQTWKGTLTELKENGLRVHAAPDPETRKRLRVDSGTKLNKTFKFDDVVALEGPVSADLVARYLVLEAVEPYRMRDLLTAAAGGGFRLRAGAGARVVVLERVESGGPFAYAVPRDQWEKSEKELAEWGAQGFRIVPSTIGAWLGKPGAVLERSPEESQPKSYRFLSTAREGTLDREFLEVVGQGYRPVGLTTPGPRVAILETGAPGSPASDYRLLSDVDSAQLTGLVRDGYRLSFCSDGEKMCVAEKTAESMFENAYRLLAAPKASALEKAMNEASLQGYRLHRAAFGVLSGGDVAGETFAVMEKSKSSTPFEYRIFSERRVPEIQKKVGLSAGEGFEVAAMTSDLKSVPSKGGAESAGIFLVVERPQSKRTEPRSRF
jgi:hypothetical protein